jgi:hypothetical protein
VEPTGARRRAPGQAAPRTGTDAPDEATSTVAPPSAEVLGVQTPQPSAGEPDRVRLGERHVELLRALAREPMRDRRGASSSEVDELIARGLAVSAFVGHAGIELTITEAGTRALAELDPPPPASVYEVPQVREELGAFLAAWLLPIGSERTQPFKANLAYLLDLVVGQALDLERGRLRQELPARLGADGPDRQALEVALAAVMERPPGPLRGRSSRSASPRT